MKLSLFNTLLLASSTLRAVALPSTVSEDANKVNHNTKQMAIRAVDEDHAVEVQNLGPWAGLGLSLVGGFAIGVATGLIVNKIQRMIDGQQSVDTKEAFLVGTTSGESIDQMMAHLAVDVARQLGSRYGVVVSEAGALLKIQVPFYELQGVALELGAGQDNFRCDLFAAELKGYIEVNERKPDGSFYQMESSGNLRLSIVNYTDRNEIRRFFFGQ